MKKKVHFMSAAAPPSFYNILNNLNMSLTSRPPTTKFDVAVNCSSYLLQPALNVNNVNVLKQIDKTIEGVFNALVRQKQVLLYGEHETGCVLTLCFLLKYYNADNTTNSILETTTACRFLQWKSGLDMDIRANLPLVESYRDFITAHA